jgi:hypothetical protein
MLPRTVGKSDDLEGRPVRLHELRRVVGAGEYVVDTQAVADALLAQRAVRHEILTGGERPAARRREFSRDHARSRLEPLRRRP